MSRRSTPQSKVDDRAFPIRVKVAVPGTGLGPRLNAYHQWLGAELGPGEYAQHATTATGTDATAFYFREIETARAFLAAFPDIVLADGTLQVGYTSPVQSAAWTSEHFLGVCNLYSMTKGQAAIRALFPKIEDRTGNLPSLPGIFPDFEAPVVANTPEGRVLTRMRWGMPSPAFALRNRKTDAGVTNIRNTKSPHWRRWLGIQHRCLVPFTSFSEYETKAGQPAVPIWFALDETRPLAFFAGIWTSWTSVRKLKEGETTNDLFGFLTTEPNKVVAPIHPKAMPVILTEPDQWEAWMTLPTEEALTLQAPLPDGPLKIVARGEKEDG